MKRTLRRMNRNSGILNDDHNPEFEPSVDAQDKLSHENHGKCEIRKKPPTLCPQECYVGYDNITGCDGPLILPPLPQ